MSRIIFNEGAQFCPDCGARLDKGEFLPTDPFFDDFNRKLKSYGKWCQLSNQQWKLLKILRIRAPKLVLTDQLINALETDTEYADPVHLIRNIIYALRPKLNGTPYIIENVSGQGRRLLKVN